MGIEAAAIPLAKMAIGGGLGAAGGALSDDPSQLSTFVDSFGNPNLERVIGEVSVDPGDILARGLQSNARLTDAVARLAGQPTQLGPASIIQQAPFAFGGALPASIGIGIRDPGFLQRPGIDLGLGMGGFAQGGRGGDDSQEDESDPEGPGQPPEGPGPFPLNFKGGGGGLPTAIPTKRGELSQFLDAVNVANMKRGRPIVRGGFA